MVEDEQRFANLVKEVLEFEGFRVSCVHNVSDARVEILEKGDFDLVLSDHSLPDGTGFDVLELVRRNLYGVPFVLLTAFGNVELAVQALKMGAVDFLTKPIDRRHLTNALKRALLGQQKTDSADWFSDQARSVAEASEHPRPTHSILVGDSDAIQKIRHDYGVADQNFSKAILIVGENGTERDQLAMHVRSSDGVRRGAIRYDIRLLHKDLLEEEFFGAEPGLGIQLASKPCVLELARGSVLVVEGLQDAEEGFIRKLSDYVHNKHPAVSDVRFVFVVTEDFFARASEHLYLQDFLSSGVPHVVRVPSFRERSLEDRRLSLNALWSRLVTSMGRPDLRMEEDLIHEMCNLPWYKNFSEIEEVMHVLALRSGGAFAQVADLPMSYRALNSGNVQNNFNLRDHVRLAKERAEKHWVDKALKETRGNVTQAAKLLGISRRGLQILMKTHASTTQV